MKRHLFETNFSKNTHVFILDGYSDLYVEISALHRVYFWGDNCIVFTAEFSHFFIKFFCQFGKLSDNFSETIKTFFLHYMVSKFFLGAL